MRPSLTWPEFTGVIIVGRGVHRRGNRLAYNNHLGRWEYWDGTPMSEVEKPCARCGRPPTAEGYDACLGCLPGVRSACCGHGVTRSYQVEEDAKGAG